MPVDSKHPSYEENFKIWFKCRRVVEGEQSVKDAGQEFLPALSKQTSEQYNAYLTRAAFFPATKRTVEGITGAAFFRDPLISEAQEEYKKAFESIGSDGQSLQVFAKNTFKEVFSLGRYGILVDINEEAPANDLPYFAGYAAESIINWRVSNQRGGKEVLEMVVLEETGFEYEEDDPFEAKPYVRYIHLELVNGVYTMTIYKKVNEKSSAGSGNMEKIVVERPTFAPTLRGRTFERLPFVFVGPTSPTPNIEDPPILDIASVNLAHFRNSADLEHGLHFTALPTAWVSGFKLAEDDSLVIGSEIAWVTEEPGASAGYLEFTGAGLRAIEAAMDRKEQQMVVLGTRLLQEEKLASEAAETLMIKKSAEVSVIGAMINSVEAGLQLAINIMADWSGAGNPPKLEINKEFMSSVINEASLIKLLALLQGNAISYETFFWNLRRSGFVEDGTTYTEELERIGKDVGAGRTFGKSPGGEGAGGSKPPARKPAEDDGEEKDDAQDDTD